MSRAECKKCLHESVCRIRTYPSQYGLTGDGCDHYKSKSLFVELPCRCKDCKHARPLGVIGCEVYICSVDTHYSLEILVEDDDFCKYAELKEEVEQDDNQ